MARDISELTNEQWEKIAPLFPEPQASPCGGVNLSLIALVLRGAWRFYVRERAGKTSRNNSPRPALVGGACGTGKSTTCGSRRGGPGASRGAIGAGRRWSAHLSGWGIFVAWSYAGNATALCTVCSFMWYAS